MIQRGVICKCHKAPARKEVGRWTIGCPHKIKAADLISYIESTKSTVLSESQLRNLRRLASKEKYNGIIGTPTKVEAIEHLKQIIELRKVRKEK